MTGGGDPSCEMLASQMSAAGAVVEPHRPSPPQKETTRKSPVAPLEVCPENGQTVRRGEKEKDRDPKVSDPTGEDKEIGAVAGILFFFFLRSFGIPQGRRRSVTEPVLGSATGSDIKIDDRPAPTQIPLDSPRRERVDGEGERTINRPAGNNARWDRLQQEDIKEPGTRVEALLERRVRQDPRRRGDSARKRVPENQPGREQWKRYIGWVGEGGRKWR